MAELKLSPHPFDEKIRDSEALELKVQGKAIFLEEPKNWKIAPTRLM